MEDDPRGPFRRDWMRAAYAFVERKTEELNETNSTRTIEYITKPSKREFKKLLKENSFKASKCYHKI